MARKSTESIDAALGFGLGFGVGGGFGLGSITGGVGFGGGSLWANPTIEQPKTKIATKNNCFMCLFIILIFSHSVVFRGTEGKNLISAAFNEGKNSARNAPISFFQTFCRNNGFKPSDSKSNIYVSLQIHTKT